MLAVLVLVSLLSLSVYGHTTAVCNVVSSDGKSVTLYAGTYHSSSQIISYGQGGLLLTTPGGVTTRYEWNGFTAHIPSNNPAIAPTCGAGGTQSCDCDACPTASHIQQRNWHRKVVSNLVDGCYSVITTTDSIIEWPWPNCFPLGFCVTGSVATASPTGPTGAPTPATRPPSPATPAPTGCVCSPMFAMKGNGYEFVSTAGGAVGGPWTRDAAQCYCQENFGTDLATVRTCEQLQCIDDELYGPGGNGGTPWIGLHSLSEQNMLFQYPDGTVCPEVGNIIPYNGQCVEDAMWGTGYPLDFSSGARCGRINVNGIENPGTCEDTLNSFICNKPGINYNRAQAVIAENIGDDAIDYISSSNNKSSFWNKKNTAIISIISLTAFILFVLINNTFLCYYCLCTKNKNKNYQTVGKNDDDI